MLETIKEAADYLRRKAPFKAEKGIILGTGLGALVDEIAVEYVIPYQEIPHFPLSTVESHSGKLIFGELQGTQVVVMQGRFHPYEGYSFDQVVFPVRVMKMLGIKALFISNAAGGINPDFEKGDLMIIEDHINLFNGNPLIGKNLDELGPRFPDMSRVYNKKLIEAAKRFGDQHDWSLQKGVYAGLSGPMLETPAEYRFLRVIGSDAVGMSTVPEVIAAHHMGMTIFACSIITDVCYGKIQPVNIAEIISIANAAQPKLSQLIQHLITQEI